VKQAVLLFFSVRQDIYEFNKNKKGFELLNVIFGHLVLIYIKSLIITNFYE